MYALYPSRSPTSIRGIQYPLALPTSLSWRRRAGDFGNDRTRGGLRIARRENRPADHEMISASGDGGGRRHDALLVAGGGAGRPDARRHQHHVSADDRAQQRRLLARADEPVDADVARLSRAFSDQL